MRLIKKEVTYRQILSLTSLEADEFYALLQEFDHVWRQYYQHYDLKGKRRRIPKYAEHADISLKGSHDKLLFILIYMKHNQTQQLLGIMFGMSQGKVSQWSRLLFPLLERTLARMQATVARCFPVEMLILCI